MSDRATIEDLLAIPEHERYHEVINGRLVAKAGASFQHGLAQFRVGCLLGPYDRESRGWRLALGVEVLFEPTQVLRPDVVAWRRERLPELPDEVPASVRPDWVCEVLSMGDQRNDLIYKKRVYQRHQVGHYWIIDPFEETLSVYRWHADGYVEVLIADRTERVRAEPFAEIELPVGVLFGDDPDD